MPALTGSPGTINGGAKCAKTQVSACGTDVKIPVPHATQVSAGGTDLNIPVPPATQGKSQ